MMIHNNLDIPMHEQIQLADTAQNRKILHQTTQPTNI